MASRYAHPRSRTAVLRAGSACRASARRSNGAASRRILNGGHRFGAFALEYPLLWSRIVDCHRDVATDGVRKASESHASHSPVPGECRSTNGPARRTTSPRWRGDRKRQLCDDESARIRNVGVDRQRFVGDEVRIDGNGELDFAVRVFEVGETDITHIRATVA
jgi:hypothetical protein